MITLYRIERFALVVFLLFIASSWCKAESPDIFSGEKTTWHGYDRFHFSVDGRKAYVVMPKQTVEGKPWVWRARFPDYHAEMDIALLGKGLSIAYLDVGGLFGCPKAIGHGEKFYQLLTKKHGFHPNPALEGVSRGGLFIYQWAIKHPDTVSCLYADTPVCDFKSWPAGKGAGIGHSSTWAACLKVYHMTEAEAMAYEKNPVDNTGPIAKAGIPILHIVSETDRVVPPKENTYLLKKHLEEQGSKMDVISVARGTSQSSGHHFTHPDPQRVVDFILKHAIPKDGG